MGELPADRRRWTFWLTLLWLAVLASVVAAVALAAGWWTPGGPVEQVTPTSEPRPTDPLCTGRNRADFNRVNGDRISINLPGGAFSGRPTCSKGHWRLEQLGQEISSTALTIVDRFRRGFQAEGWEPVVDTPHQLVYQGPCSPTLACEATVDVIEEGQPVAPYDVVIDVVLVGRRDPACTAEHEDAFNRVNQDRIAPVVPARDHRRDRVGCSDGVWRLERLEREVPMAARAVLEQLRKGFEAEGWEPVSVAELSFAYQGPCNATLACEVSVDARPSSDSESVVDLTMTGHITAPPR